MHRWSSLLFAVLAACALSAGAQEGAPAAPAAPADAPAAEPPKEGANPMILIKTSKGDIKVELFEKQAPETVKNFLQYVDDKHYDGTIFHRVIRGFMVQGGGFTTDMQQKPTRAPVKNEAGNGLKNDRGTIAMARTQVADSATSQFFINVVDNAFLNRAESQDGVGYCVFGRVVEGMEAVDAIRNVATGRRGYFSDVPVEPVLINQIVRVTAP